MPVRLIDKDSPEVTDNVDNSEHETSSGEHGQVRTLAVTIDQTAGVFALFVERDSICVREDGFTFSGALGDGVVQQVVDLVTGVELDVHQEDHCHEDCENDDLKGKESDNEK